MSARQSIVVLDDYQHLARDYGAWGRISDSGVVTIHETKIRDVPTLVGALEPHDVVVVLRERTPITRELISRLPRLKLLVTTGPYNAAIDLAAASEFGIPVSHTRLSMTSTTEFTWALIFAVSRRICEEDQFTRSGGWQMVRPLGPELKGRTLGLIGLGQIGREVARIASAFGMHVIAWSENLEESVAKRVGVRAVTKEELFRSSDFVSIHTRLSDRTRGLVGADELALMKTTAYLINTSRGFIVDEAALLEALRTGTIAGAALDVYDIEPLPADHAFLSLSQVVLSPHLAAMTSGHVQGWFDDVVENIEAWIAGEPIRLLNPNYAR